MTLASWTLSYLWNSAWQTPLIFCGAAAISRLCGGFRAGTQHKVWVASLAAEAVVPALPAAPAVIGIRLHQLVSRVLHFGVSNPGVASVSLGRGAVQIHAGAATALNILAGMYLVTCMYFGTRLLYGVWANRSLLRAAHPVMLGEADANTWPQLEASFGVRDVALVQSNRVDGPSTVGLFRETVVVPIKFFDNVQESDRSAALAHELAHIARRDYAKSLLYRCVMLPLSYHPFAWITNARVRETREMVCDELAAAVTGGGRNYAQSLLRLAASCLPKSGAMSTAIGIFDAQPFERRIMSLLEENKPLSYKVRAAKLAAAALVCLTVCSTAVGMHVRIGEGGGRGQTAPVAKSFPVSAEVITGQLISKVDPVYPPIAQAAHVSGNVLLDATIGKDGKMQRLHVLSGPPMLYGAALDAVRQWTYKPYQVDGEAVEVNTTITVTFQPAK